MIDYEKLRPEHVEWVKACEAGLCAQYDPLWRKITYSITTERLCEHARCDGILDVVDRMFAIWHHSGVGMSPVGCMRSA